MIPCIPCSAHRNKTANESASELHLDTMDKEVGMIRKASMIWSALALCALFATAGFAKEITIRGKLQKTVEANGWLIVAGKQKYLILNPEKFRNEKWFAETREVEATGEVKKGVVSIYMEGTPFDVH